MSQLDIVEDWATRDIIKGLEQRILNLEGQLATAVAGQQLTISTIGGLAVFEQLTEPAGVNTIALWRKTSIPNEVFINLQGASGWNFIYLGAHP